MTDPRGIPVGANLEAFVAAVRDAPILRRAGIRDALVAHLRHPVPALQHGGAPPTSTPARSGADRRPGRPDDRPRPALVVVGDAGTRAAPGHARVARPAPRGRARDVRRAGRAGGPAQRACASSRSPPDEDPTYLDVFMAGFELPDFVREPMADLLQRCHGPRAVRAPGRLGGRRPVGCGTVFLAPAPPGSTTSRCSSRRRGRGIGHAITAALMNVGVAAGCRTRSCTRPSSGGQSTSGSGSRRSADPAVDLDAAGGDEPVARTTDSAREIPPIRTPRREIRARHVRTGV